VPLFKCLVMPLCIGAAARVSIFLHGIFSLTQEVNEWRFHRHEYRSDL
jgi:hypothetical protein